MAASRAALSVSATVGVAFATLVVVGGILAGPAIVECSSDPNGFGTCLRDKAVDSGLLAPDATAPPDMVADISSEPSLPPAPAGWMEANANEYEPPARVPVDLTGSPADMVAAELPPPSEPAVEVAVVPPMELATGIPESVDTLATVTLDGAEPGLVAEGASSREPAPATEVALVGPQGGVTAMSPVPEVTLGGAAALTPPDGLVVEAPVPEETASPVELQAEVSVEPIEAPPPIAIEFNPQYPNVLVLPPPTSGDNSSFRSLQLN